MNTYVFFLKKYLSLTLNENKFDLILETESLHLKRCLVYTSCQQKMFKHRLKYLYRSLKITFFVDLQMAINNRYVYNSFFRKKKFMLN